VQRLKRGVMPVGDSSFHSENTNRGGNGGDIGNASTRYVHPTTGQSVVFDDVTKEVIHLGGPGFKY
jgi:hypothetical protein